MSDLRSATNSHRETLQTPAMQVLHLPPPMGKPAERKRRGFKLMCIASQSQTVGGHPTGGALHGKIGALNFLACVAPCRRIEQKCIFGFLCQWVTCLHMMGRSISIYVWLHIQVTGEEGYWIVGTSTFVSRSWIKSTRSR